MKVYIIFLAFFLFAAPILAQDLFMAVQSDPSIRAKRQFGWGRPGWGGPGWGGPGWGGGWNRGWRGGWGGPRWGWGR
ncbi:hypothetical protein QR680_011600 [Steinernema hermaphroditum]|uniref:Uncharacterized protein n=1 Tax=Steinernema hermaphroditum TaxID=289476 RepID=A0AA39HZ19_9BILA|nr:hypothetical protein QR680_011600 [Steinernema hermaphroditum]